MNKILSVFLGIIWIVGISATMFFLGVLYESKYGEDLITVGCWKPITETNRSIAIMVAGRDLEEIIDTARHEICHEIDFRLMDYNTTEWNNKDKKSKEEFAKNCNPEVYLNITKRR